MQEESLSYRRSNLIFIFLIVINLFFLTSHMNVYVRTFKHFIFYVLNPMPASAEKVIESGGQVLNNIKEIVSVHQENERLRQELEKYKYLEKDYANLSNENEKLGSILKIIFPQKRKAVVSRVVSRESSSWFEWIIIDKGYEEGLAVDSPVLVWVDNKLTAIGRVWEVYHGAAKVILLTNTLCSVPVEIKDLNEDGLIEGQNNSLLMLNYLLPESKAKAGDEVITSPISQVFPPGINVGYVENVYQPTRNNTLKIATVKPSFGRASLKFVAVLIPGEKRQTK